MKISPLLASLVVSGLAITGLIVPAIAADGVVDADETIYFAARNGLSCSGCHGIAGGGGGEGGISIPPVAGVVGAGNRYGDAATFCRLLATGQAPGGVRISNLMPRYSLTKSDCTALFRFAASLSVPLFADDGNNWSVQLNHDNRSLGQSAWQSAVVGRLAQANDAGGLYGRKFAVNAGDTPVIIVDLTANRASRRSVVPTILLQATGGQALVKAIESSRADEARAVAASYPGETVVVIDPLKAGPDRALLAAAAEASGTEIVDLGNCASASQKPTRAIIFSMTRAPDFGLTPLSSCGSVQSVAISLRNVTGDAIAAAAQKDLLPAQVLVFTPVPVGEQFAEIPKTISTIIIDMARRMGANPTRAVQLEAFEQAWKMQARGDGALFSGASITEVDPVTLAARSEPLWHDAP